MKPLQSIGLVKIPWIEHGFGTRYDGSWTPFEATARVSQVHSAGVAAVLTPGDQGDGDALITNVAEIWLEIQTADCVPLLLADPVRRVIAAIHAGWRGTAAEISRVTVESLKHVYGSNAADLQAAIGPCIAACCFEVGDEVASYFPDHTNRSSLRPHVDLVDANRQQLIGAGVPKTHIESLILCTVCDGDRFHSFRRDRGAGRMTTAIRIRRKD